MSFMQPVIDWDSWYEIETTDGTELIPASLVDYVDTPAGREDLLDYVSVCSVDNILSVKRIDGYGARLSASGFMDATDWTLHDTEALAAQYLIDTYYDQAPEDETEEETAEREELEEIVRKGKTDANVQ